MTTSLIPRKLLSFPSLTLPDFWDEDEEWLSSPSTQSGLSVYEDENKVYVEAAVPGIDPKNVDVTFQDGYVWVRGESKEEEEDKKKKYYRKASRSFSYRVAVPGDVDSSKDPEATYKHGVMTITFMKSPKVQPKKIQVKTAEQKKLYASLNYWEDGKKYDVESLLIKSTKPKLFLYGLRDEFTSLDEIKELFKKVPEPKILHWLDSNHDYRYYPSVVEEVNRLLSQFLDEFPVL